MYFIRLFFVLTSVFCFWNFPSVHVVAWRGALQLWRGHIEKLCTSFCFPRSRVRMNFRRGNCVAVVLLCVWVKSAFAEEGGGGFHFFHRGRIYNGNLGVLAREHLQRNEDSRNVLEEYFDQHLDHFSPTDTRKWKQVGQRSFKAVRKLSVLFVRLFSNLISLFLTEFWKIVSILV